MFKRDTNVYLQVTDGAYYKLPVYPDAAFSQVYSEVDLPKKTLHNPEKLISSGFTSSLNPGTFTFTIPLIDTASARGVAEALADRNPKSHSIYLENDSTIFQLRKCVIESVVFNIAQDQISTVTLSGSYADSIENTLPSSPIILGQLYTYVQGLRVLSNNLLINNITSVNFEISNAVAWLDNKTMHDTTPIARSNFVLSGKTVSGTIVANGDMTLPEYRDHLPLLIEVNFGGSSFLSLEADEAILTKRNQLDTVVKNGYDFRATTENYTIKYRGVNIT
jgi:hypothetical protein